MFFYCAQSKIFHATNHVPVPDLLDMILSRFGKTRPRWRPQHPPPTGQRAQLTADPSRLLVILLKSTEICRRFQRFKPRVGWEATQGGTSARPPNPEIFCLFVQKPGLEFGKDFGWFSPIWFFHTPFFWGGEPKFHSFWTRLKQEKNGSFPSTTWVFCLHHGNSSASNFGSQQVCGTLNWTYSPEKLTWPAGKSPPFNRRYIFKWLAFPLSCQFSGT